MFEPPQPCFSPTIGSDAGTDSEGWVTVSDSDGDDSGNDWGGGYGKNLRAGSIQAH